MAGRGREKRNVTTICDKRHDNSRHFFFCSGGEGGVRGAREGGPVSIENARRGVSQERGGGPRPGGCLRGIWIIWRGGRGQIFSSGPEFQPSNSEENKGLKGKIVKNARETFPNVQDLPLFCKVRKVNLDVLNRVIRIADCAI